MGKKRDKLEEKFEAILDFLDENDVYLELDSNYGVEDIVHLSDSELKDFVEYLISENMLESEMDDIEYRYYKNDEED